MILNGLGVTTIVLALVMSAIDHFDRSQLLADAVHLALGVCVSAFSMIFGVADGAPEATTPTLVSQIPVFGVAVAAYAAFIIYDYDGDFGEGREWPWYTGYAVWILPVTGVYALAYLATRAQLTGLETAAGGLMLLTLTAAAAPLVILGVDAYEIWVTVEKPEVMAS